MFSPSLLASSRNLEAGSAELTYADRSGQGLEGLLVELCQYNRFTKNHSCMWKKAGKASSAPEDYFRSF